MDADELQENAWIDYMGARQSALEAAVGHFVTLNVPTPYLKEIVRAGTPKDVIVFAAQIALHARGEQWRPEPCGSTNSEKHQPRGKAATQGSQPVDMPGQITPDSAPNMSQEKKARAHAGGSPPDSPASN